VPDNLNGPGYQTTPEDIAKGQEAVAAALKAIHSQS